MELLKTRGSNEARRKKLVGFSFDDGPDPNITLGVLNTLIEEGIPATHFWILEYARNFKQSHPNLFAEILAKISKGKHEIELHAPNDYNPSVLTRAYGRFTKRQLADAKAGLEDLTGQPVRFYRPHILLQPVTIYHAGQIGLITVLGDLIASSANADSKIETQIARFSRARAGSILIFHDGTSFNRQKTHIIDVLPQVIANIRRNGLNPTKLSEVL